MKFKEINFNDATAKRIYMQYINQVKHAVKDLNKENQNDTLLEINSHIYESFANSDKNEVDNILDVTERLGNPETFLKELVAEKKLDEATRSFNPFKIIKALLLNLTNGVYYIIFFFLYLSLFSFIFLILMKLVDPENVGLFYKKSEVLLLGVWKGSKDYSDYEQLGNMFIPAMLILTFILYLIITLLLRIKRIFKK